MDPQTFFRIVLRHKWIILLLCLSAIVHGVLITYVVSEKYEATALVLIKPEERIGITTATPFSRKEVVDIPGNISLQVETPSKTYIEVIKSRAVAEKVVRLLSLDKKKRAPSTGYYKELWERSKENLTDFLNSAWEIMKYGRPLNVDRLETAVEKLTKNMSLSAIKNTYLFEIKYKSEDPEEAAAVANTAAAMFVEYNSIASQIEAKSDREFIAAQLKDSENEVARARRALREFKEQNKSISFEEETTATIKIISDLESALGKTETALSGLLEQLTPSNPKVMKLQAEQQYLLNSIIQKKLELKRLPEKESQLATLKLTVKTAEGVYELLGKEYEEARIREAKKTREIRLASPASIPTSPKKPIKIEYAAVSFLLALLTGIGLALIIESMQTKLSTVDGVEEYLGLPVLATIPRIQT